MAKKRDTTRPVSEAEAFDEIEQMYPDAQLSIEEQTGEALASVGELDFPRMLRVASQMASRESIDW